MNKFYRKPKPETMKKNRETYAEAYKDEIKWLKDNVQTISSGLSKVNQLRGVSFTRNDHEDTEVVQLGVIAQEVESVLPELVTEDKDSGLKGVAYTKMVAVLIEAVKELSDKVEALENA